MNRPESNVSQESVIDGSSSLLVRVNRLIQDGQYGQALNLVHASGRDLTLKNAKGVCLLRLGKYDEAVSVYREIVFKQGCVWVRPEIPTIYKVNFATALLLAGQIEGGLSVLGQAMDEGHPGVVRLRQSIRRWKQSFTLWQRIMWLFGGMNDAKSPLELDFLPGILDEGLIQERVAPEKDFAGGKRPAA
ncbi:hypothetical protein AB1K70_22060 [Bremerella sp. JC770]|uniref:tetratricopeptide repeat protein n=1 Tax=Bremerella sp. JC770 TaxID=3232137 RepID=UPI0034586BEA